MNKLLALVFGVGLFWTTAAQATLLYRGEPAFIVPVASGCGIGVHRGPFNDCNVIYSGYRHAYFRGYDNGYHDGYFDGSYGYSPGRLVDQGACSGLKPFPVCAPHGPCWAACYGRVEFGW